MSHVFLASASPRRSILLKQLGVDFRVYPADIDEERYLGETPLNYVKRVALAKAVIVRQRLLSDEHAIVIGADTAVVVNGDVLGKPHNRDDAISMLARLSGTTHKVFSAVAIAGGHDACIVNISDVTFRKIQAWEGDLYWQTGEPADKAGAYAIQGVGALFIEKLNGSYSGVMGLPLFETGLLLKQFGIRML